MKNKYIRKSLALALAISILAPSLAMAKSEEETRSEFVFSQMENEKINGEKTVSVWQTGDKKIDFSEINNLKDVENLKSSEEVKKKGNEILWKSDKKDLYYQGKTDKQLPISVNLDVRLDGSKIDYNKLKGKKGHVVLTINLKNKEYKDVNIDGENRRIYRPYLADIVFTASDSTIKNLGFSSGNIVKDGSNVILNALIAPGMEESLVNDLDNIDLLEDFDLDEYLKDELTIEMDVENFDPQMLMIGFTNLSLDEKELKDANSLEELKEGIKSLKTNGDKLLDATKQMSQGQDQFREGIEQLTSGTEKLSQGSEKLTSGIKEVDKNVGKLSQASSELSNGSGRVYGGINKLSQGSKAYKEGVKKYSQNMGLFSREVQGLTEKLNDSEKIDQLDDATSSLSSGAKTLNTGLSTANGKFTELNSKTNSLSENYGKMNSGIGELNKNSKEIKEASGKLSESSIKINTGAKDLSQGLKSIAENSQKLEESSKAFADTINNTPGSAGINSQNISTNLKEAEALIASLSQDPELMEDPNMAKAIGTLETILNQEQAAASELSAGSENIMASSESLKSNANALYQGMAKLNGGIKSLNQGFDSLQANTDEYAKKMSAFDESLGKFAGGIGNLEESSGEVKAGVNSLYENQAKLLEGYKSMEEGSQKLAMGNEKLNQESQNVRAKLLGSKDQVGSLLNATEKLNQGSIMLKEKYDEVDLGIGSLANGFTDLNNGLILFNKGVNDLHKQGSQKLVAGSSELSNGIKTLNSKMPELSAGNKKLQDGSHKLEEAMGEYMEKGINKLDQKTSGTFNDIDKIIKVKDELVKMDSSSEKSFTGYDGDVKTQVNYLIKID